MQLAEAVEKEFGVKVVREAMRLRILQLGYCWKRTRYVPYKQVDPEEERDHKANLDTLKRGAGQPPDAFPGSNGICCSCLGGRKEDVMRVDDSYDIPSTAYS